jgi:predicted small secreted protein
MPDDDKTGDIMSWVITFILLIAFWPIGLIVLLKKLNVFAKPAKRAVRHKIDRAVDDARRAQSQYKDAAREAEGVAREAASDIAKSAREAGYAARRAITEIYADLTREFKQSQSTRPGADRSASYQPSQHQSQSQSQTQTQSQPQSQSAASPPQYQRTAALQPQTARAETSWRTAAKSRKSKSKIKKERTALEKKSGKFVSVVLLIISIAMFILGANTIAGAARDIWVGGVNRWPDFFLGVFYFAGGLISFFSRNIGVRRFARYKRYHVFVSGRGVVPIPDIVKAAGLSARVVRRDIQAMINEGYLDRGAYIDRDLNCLILSAEAVEEMRRAGSDDGSARPADAEKPENQYMAIILELREVNSSIADITISRKAERIEELSAKIFRIVEENPEKLPQIRRFMNYYLPTTIKLLRSYATLEKQGVKGENITGTKESIGRILDTLAAGYEQQLDQLFTSDALDIAADINVLETLMQQDGLT